MTATERRPAPAARGARPGGSSASGLVLAISSAVAFGTSGPFVKPLLDAGWSPAAAVAVRAGAGALVLLVPSLFALRGRFSSLLRSWRLIVAYGLVAVIGAQVFYFAAIGRLPVGIALLIEYTAPILLVLLAWARTRVSPPLLTIAGAVLSVIGLACVINPTGVGGLDALGIGFALLAALCLAGYYLIAAAPMGELPPVALVSSGLLLGSLGLGLIGVLGLVPFTLSWDPVTLLDTPGVPWFVPMGVVVLVATAFAYLTGLLGAVRLGSRVASFVGLIEVLSAVLLSWLMLGEVPSWLQALGGAFIIAGVVFVKLERPAAAIEPFTPDPAASAPVAAPDPSAAGDPVAPAPGS